MKIHFSCPFCQKAHSVDAALAGRKGRCKDCGTTMQIPGKLAKSAAPAAATPASNPRPAPKPRPAPPLPPPPADDVDDPYGLADEPAPMPIRSDMLADSAGDVAPLPRGGASKPGGGAKQKKKRGRDEGPWGVPFRQGAVALMALVLVLARMMKYARRAHQEQEVGPFIFIGMLVLCLLAAALSVVSVVGALISFSRGNRSAFRGESTGGQVAWGLSVLASVVVAYLYLGGVGPFGTVRTDLAALDASLSATEQAPLAVYEDLVGSVIQYQKRLADTLDRLGTPEAGPGFAAAMELSVIESEAQMIQGRSRVTPAPTREQTSLLFVRFADTYREGVTRAARAARDAMGRLDAPADSPAGKAMQEVVDNTSRYADANVSAYPEGSADSTGWYFAIFSKDAGSVARGAAPTLVRGPAPDRASAPPSFPGPDPGPPPGQLPPEMQRELERFQRESGDR